MNKFAPLQVTLECQMDVARGASWTLSAAEMGGTGIVACTLEAEESELSRLERR